MKKRWIALVLALCMVWTLSACTGETPSRKPIQEDGAQEDQQGRNTAGEKEEEKEEQEEQGLPTVEKQVLLDQDGLMVTAVELTEGPIWGIGLKLLVENNSQRNYALRCDTLAVNGYMMSTLLFSADVAAGKKANETMYFSDGDLEGAGIVKIMDITARFAAYDPDSYEDLWGPVEVNIPTSAAGSEEQPAMDEGKELYNQNGVRIVGRYVEEDTLWGAGVVLFLENTGEEDVVVSCDDMSVNGFMVTPYLHCQVNADCRAMANITVMESDLEANGIQAVENIQLTFQGYSPDSYDTLFQTDPVEFSVAQ